MAKSQSSTADKFTVAEAAAQLGIPMPEMERLIREGKITPSFGDHGEYITKEDIELFRKEHAGLPGANS
jgi:hypothetical protein